MYAVNFKQDRPSRQFLPYIPGAVPMFRGVGVISTSCQFVTDLTN